MAANKKSDKHKGQRSRVEIRQADLARIVEESLNEIYLFDESTLRFIDVNRSARENLGYTIPELEKLTPLDIKPEYTPQTFGELVEPLRSGSKKVIVFETRHKRKDETTYWVEVHLQIGVFSGDRVFIAIILDITERKRAAESLEVFQFALENAPDAVFFMTRDAGFSYVNEQACKSLGYTREELLKLTLSDIDPIFPKESWDALWGKPQGEGGSATTAIETIHRRKSGTEFSVEVLAKHLWLDNQEFHVAFVRDISDRQKVEESLKQGEASLAKAQEIAKVGSWSWDIKKNKIEWSDQYFRMVGLDKEKFGANYDAYLRCIHPDDLEFFKDTTQKVLRDKKPYNLEYRIVQPNKTIRFIHERGEVTVDEKGNAVQLFGTAQDITARKEEEEKRYSLERQMQQAQKLESLGVLAGGIAHDFNNLLTSILGYSDLVKQTLPVGDPAHDYIQEVVKGSRQAAALTQQMLAYSGKGRFVIQALSFSAVVEDMTRLLEISISKKCVLKYEFMPDLPAIEADPAQMRQIIMNLVINASESIGNRSGVIAVSTGVMFCDRAYLAGTYLDENLPEKLYVYLEVSDNGAGMSEETRVKIFDPFFTTKFTGRGLGLAAVLGIVRGHHGTVQVYSEVKKGTTFKILIPASEKPVVAEEGLESQVLGWRGSGTVLIVDDEESVLGLARVMLEKMGFSVLTAENGREGVEVFRREAERISLVLLDMTMPHLDGAEVFREIRQIRGDIKTILSSGYNEQSATNRFAGKGLAGFIQKPYRYEDLLAVVQKVMEA